MSHALYVNAYKTELIAAKETSCLHYLLSDKRHPSIMADRNAQETWNLQNLKLLNFKNSLIAYF